MVFFEFKNWSLRTLLFLAVFVDVGLLRHIKTYFYLSKILRPSRLNYSMRTVGSFPGIKRPGHRAG